MGNICGCSEKRVTYVATLSIFLERVMLEIGEFYKHCVIMKTMTSLPQKAPLANTEQDMNIYNNQEAKHAYLIIAHDKFEQPLFLIKLLDLERNDIY